VYGSLPNVAEADFFREEAKQSTARSVKVVESQTSAELVVAVRRRSGDQYLFAVVGGDTQLAWPRLRTVVGVNKTTLPDAASALAATGYERGTITPIGAAGDWPVYVDSRLVGRRVAMGSGAHGYSAFVRIDDLVEAYSATVADLTG
jgi:prolyl-tRNA editing enzyme YbaK/EbsC (Cys-tRNA(Pro) deacylase)